MRKERSKVDFFVARWGKTDSAKWKERTVKSLTNAQLRIRYLCKAFLAGEVTSEEFKRELPPILTARDREKRNLNA